MKKIIILLGFIASILVIQTSTNASQVVVENAISWAISIANDDSHGYSQSNRWGPDYDCSSFVISAFKSAGIDTGTAVNTRNMRSQFTQHGFQWIPWSQIGGESNLQRGDVLLNEGYTGQGHTEIYLGNGQNVGAHSNRGYPQTGDQTGTEVSVSGFYIHPWDGVLRYKDLGNNPEGNCEAIYGNTGSITIDGWVIDKDSKSEPIELHVYIGGPEGEGHPGIIANKYRPDVPISLNDAALGDYHGFKDTIPTKKTGNQDVYVYAINVGSGENTLLKKQTVYIEPDVTNPSITEDKVSDITNDGYTITCKVTDNVTVSRVVFCTWTEANGQDDIVEEDGVASGDTYTYRVNRSDHNNEYGNYITH